MLQVHSDQLLRETESALRRAAHRNEASILAVTHIGQFLREKDPEAQDDAIVFTVCHHELYSALLAADVRTAAFLPCRIAAYSQAGRVTLETVSPLEFGRLLNRPDLFPLAGPLERVLCRIMEDAAAPLGEAVPAGAGVHRGGLGATEDQVNVRGSIPQRIDCHGTKVEELAGTGEHDSHGG
jgi:uncharacterized protein (DUF302 family)